MRDEAIVRSELVDSQARLDAISQQIAEAKAHTAETGDYTDSEWFLRATAARRIAARTHGKLQVELGEVRRAQKKENGETWKPSWLTEDDMRRIIREELDAFFPE